MRRRVRQGLKRMLRRSGTVTLPRHLQALSALGSLTAERAAFTGPRQEEKCVEQYRILVLAALQCGLYGYFTGNREYTHDLLFR